jgi:hypothetical protein
MWKFTVLVQLCALEGGRAVGWMINISSINFWQWKIFSHLESIQTVSEASPASYSFFSQGKVAGPVSNPLITI